MTGYRCCQQPFAVREGLQASKEGERGGGGEWREGGGDRAAEEGHYWK